MREDFFVYEPGDSPLHRANPVLKLVLLVALATFLTGAKLVALLSAAVALPFLVFLAKTRPASVAGGSFFVSALVLSFGILSLIDIDVRPFAVRFSAEGIRPALMYWARIMVIYFYNALFYATTPLSELRRSLARAEDKLFPSLPQAQRLSLTLMLFLKFIQLCITEWHELDRAWASRCGAKGLRRLIVLVPKFITRMLRKAGEIAEAMTARALS